MADDEKLMSHKICWANNIEKKFKVISDLSVRKSEKVS